MKKIALIILTAMLLSLTVAPAQAANPTMISATAPITNSDGTPLTDLAGLRFYFGKTSKTYTVVVSVPGTTIGATVDYLFANNTSITYGTWYATVAAYDTSGNESIKYSPELSFTLVAPDTTAPAPAPGCVVK